MSAPVIVIPPPPLHVAAALIRRSSEELTERVRQLHTETLAAGLNGADPGFNPGSFRDRCRGVWSQLGSAADGAFIDVSCVERTVEQATVADAVGPAGVSGGNAVAAVGLADLDANRDSPVIGPDVPLNPIWYLEELGRLATELDQRMQFAAGACVGVCLNAAFQDGVLTTSFGAGLAYSISADATVKPIMSEEERTLDWEEHRVFGAGPWIGAEVTKRVNDDGTTEPWSLGGSAGLSPIRAGGGWVYQWNRRDELWSKGKDEDDRRSDR